MATRTGTALGSIGQCLRVTREGRGLTLEQLAEISGVSKSHLSRLESSERQPSVASLLALSDALGVSVSALFGEGEGATPLAVSPPDRPSRESNGLVISPCSGYAGSSVIDALRLTVPADRTPPIATRHPGEEWLYVLSGTLALEYDGATQHLGEGAAAHFNAELPHRLAAAGPGPVEVLLVAAKPIRNLLAVH